MVIRHDVNCLKKGGNFSGNLGDQSLSFQDGVSKISLRGTCIDSDSMGMGMGNIGKEGVFSILACRHATEKDEEISIVESVRTISSPC